MTHCNQASRRSLLKWSAGLSSAALLGVSSAPTSSAQGAPTVALITGPSSDAFWTTLGCGVSAAAAQAGIAVQSYAPSRFDPSEQTSLLDAAAQAGHQAILIAPADRSAMIEPIRQATSDGQIVLTVDTMIDEPLAAAAIGSDNVLGGQMAVWALAELTGGSATVYLSTTRPGISTTDQRQQGFESALADYPGITYVGSEFNDNDPAIAYQQIIAALQNVPDISAIAGTNLAGSLGAAQAVRDAGRAGSVAVVGFDASPELVAFLDDGTVAALIAQHPYEMGISALQTATEIVHTGSFPANREIITDYTVVTQGNRFDPIVDRILYVHDCSQIPEIEATPSA